MKNTHHEALSFLKSKGFNIDSRVIDYKPIAMAMTNFADEVMKDQEQKNIVINISNLVAVSGVDEMNAEDFQKQVTEALLQVLPKS